MKMRNLPSDDNFSRSSSGDSLSSQALTAATSTCSCEEYAKHRVAHALSHAQGAQTSTPPPPMLVTAYRDDNDFSLKRKLTFLILYMLILEYTLFLLWSLEYEPWPNADAGHEPWPYKADD